MAQLALACLDEALALARSAREAAKKSHGGVSYPSDDDLDGADSRRLSELEVAAFTVASAIGAAQAGSTIGDLGLVALEGWHVSRQLAGELVRQLPDCEEVVGLARAILRRLSEAKDCVAELEVVHAAASETTDEATEDA